MKQCPDCGESKAPSEFGKNRNLADGLSFYCMTCNRRRNSAWYRKSRAELGKEVRDYSWVPEGFRWCPSCRQAISHDDFIRNPFSSSGFGGRCKPCHRRQDKETYFRRRYGLSREQVLDMRAAQQDACAICGDPRPEHLDHDHETGTVRQLLCQRCNFGLGQYREDPGLLRAAAAYVERHRPRRPQRGRRAPDPGPDPLGGPGPRR